MTREQLNQWFIDHLFIENTRTMIADNTSKVHYKVEYVNGDSYEFKAESPTIWREYCTTWINNKIVEKAEYKYFNFGWKRIG